MGGGVPDVHICAESYPFWVELKTTKTNRINISSGQIAWNHAYWRSGGVSFFLVHPLKGRNLYLFAGDKGRELATHGLAVRGSGSGAKTSVDCLWSGSGLEELWGRALDLCRSRVGDQVSRVGVGESGG